jgi:hypothetical protein
MFSKEKKKEKRKKEETSTDGDLWEPSMKTSNRLMLELAYLMPHFWLVVSLHPEGPATGQLDQGFPWFSLVPEQMLSWYPNSTLRCMLHMQPSEW